MFRWPQNGRSRWTEPSKWIIFPASFNRDENKAIGALSREFIGFKAAAWTLENKNCNVHISPKLNSAFSTIGKATANKITAKLVGKTCVNNQFEHAFMQRIDHVCEISNIFVLLDKFFYLIFNENLLLLNFLSRFFHLVAFIWEF